jgi:GxxExxY protein
VRTKEPISGELNALSRNVIGAAIGVHKALGPGLLESLYEEALCVELELRGIPFARQVACNVTYKDHSLGDARIDLLVDGMLVVELKSVDQFAPVHTAQVISYLKATQCRLGLLINFKVTRLTDGVKRIIR